MPPASPTMGISAAMSHGPAPSRRNASSWPVATRRPPWQVPDPADGLRISPAACSAPVQSSVGRVVRGKGGKFRGDGPVSLGQPGRRRPDADGGFMQVAGRSHDYLAPVRVCRSRQCTFPGFRTAYRGPATVQDGRGDQAGRDAAVLLQGDQGSPLGLTCQEARGSVNRINDPPAVAVATRSAFFAEERVTGAQPAKAPAQTVLYFAIGGGDRRSIALDVLRHVTGREVAQRGGVRLIGEMMREGQVIHTWPARAGGGRRGRAAPLCTEEQAYRDCMGA